MLKSVRAVGGACVETIKGLSNLVRLASGAATAVAFVVPLLFGMGLAWSLVAVLGAA
jgi:hypothetical protein